MCRRWIVTRYAFSNRKWEVSGLMEGSFKNRERRRYPRVLISLPLEYQDTGNSCLRGAMVVNAGEGGFLIESTRDVPVGKEDPKGNQCWEGYRYGLEFIRILEQDRWKLNWLLVGRFEFEEIFSSLCCQL
jgi:hypothetical protein